MGGVVVAPPVVPPLFGKVETKFVPPPFGFTTVLVGRRVYKNKKTSPAMMTKIIVKSVKFLFVIKFFN